MRRMNSTGKWRYRPGRAGRHLKPLFGCRCFRVYLGLKFQRLLFGCFLVIFRIIRIVYCFFQLAELVDLIGYISAIVFLIDQVVFKLNFGIIYLWLYA